MTRFSKRPLFTVGLLAGLVALPLTSGLAGAETAFGPAVRLAQARSVQTPTQTPARGSLGVSDAVAKVAQSITPSVVTVRGAGDDRRTQSRGTIPELLSQLFPREFQLNAPRPDITGSGFVVDSNGYVVTNQHVVEGATAIEVTLWDGRKLPAQVMRSDPSHNVALLKVEATGLLRIPLGSSAGLQMGELVMAVARQAGQNPTITVGSVSSREGGIGTDIPISRETSGGPLVTMRGEAVGVTTALTHRSSDARTIGAAVPVDTAGSILQPFLAAQPEAPPVMGASLGASIQPLTSELARTFGLTTTQGVLVTSVDPSSPAGLAGLQPADVIVRFDGRPVRNPQELASLLAGTPASKTVEVGIMRNRAPRSLRVALTEATDIGPADPREGRGVLERAGLEFQRLTPRLARRLGIRGESGVVVTEVRPDSPAARAGIAVGDLIREVDRAEVETVFQAEQRMTRATEESNQILLRLERDHSQRYVLINLG
ncbi:MAG: PDZ domain-containing protein [Candidatus Rokuibacteriota bacterium]